MSESYKRGAAYAVGFSIAGKVFSFAVSLLFAFYFGADGRTDVYFYLILLAALLNGWLNTTNAAVILPEFMHLRQKDGRAAINFANFFLYIYLCAAAILIAACWLWPGQILGFISAFPRAQAMQNSGFMPLAAIYFSSFFIMAFLISLAESFKLFKIYFLSPLNSVLPFAALLMTRKIEALLLGYIAAYLIQICASVFLLKKHAGWHFGFKKPVLGKKFIHNLLYNQPGSAAWAILLYVPLFMLTGATAGLVSAVNYSRMLTDGLLDILVSRINNVAKVKLMAEAAAQDFKNMAATLLKTDKILLFILMLICVFTAFYSYEICKMFFMRGSFTAQDAYNTSIFLKIFVLAVPLVSMGNNIGNAFSALRLIKEIMPYAVAVAVVFTVAFIGGIYKYGAFAYPLIFLMLYLTVTAVNFANMKQFAPFLLYSRNISFAAKLFAINFICAVITAVIFKGFFHNIFVELLVNGSIFVTLSFSLSWKMLKEELWK